MNISTQPILTALAIAGTLTVVGTAQAAAIHHWSFDTDGTDSIGGNTGTATSAAVSFGNAGGAFGGFMDDTQNTAYSDLASNIVLQASIVTDTDGWAISYWANNWDFNDHFIGDADTDQTVSAMWFRNNLTDPRMQIRNIGQNVSIDAFGANVDNTDNWTHFTFVREADGTMTWYVDGTGYVNVDGNGDPTGLTLQVDFTVNAIGTGAAGNSSGFVGDLDEVWIFDAALSQSEVAGLLNNNQVPEPTSLALLGLGGLCMLRRRR